MITSEQGRDFIKSFEKCRLSSYDDGVGVWTIGWGRTKSVQRGDECTQEQADDWFDDELIDFEQGVTSAVKQRLSQNEFDACVSLSYNIGISAFQRSTLCKMLNLNDFTGAAKQFDVWNKGGGQVMQGLVKRRAAERKIFESAEYVNHN